MKTYKKIFLGLPIFLFLGTFLLGAKPALAAPENPQSARYYYSSCIDNVGANNLGGTNCTFFSSSNLPSQDLLFDDGSFELAFILNDARYQVSYKADGYSKPPPPARITILNDSDKAITLASNPFIGDFKYSGQSFTSTRYKILTFIYTSTGDPDYVMLVGLKTNGDPPLILAMVNKQIQDDPRGDNRGTVYAYEINKLAIGSTSTGAVISPTAATGESDNSCESNFSSGFEWVLCPGFKLADSAAGSFNSFVEDQMCFKTTTESSSSTGSSIVCSGNNNLDSGVKNAWNTFKNIASALLVIALLVMVFSQAIGGGPFDAYTVRKMLPKLVAAVIIMQLSWVLLKFAIDLSNDVGSAIGSLLMAPFGGKSSLNLDKIMGSAFDVHTVGTNDTFAFFTVLAAGTAAFIVSIPTLALMALYVVIALLTAFLVLIFRKLLIILLVILAPIALVLWILPGTEKYWKLWQDNFIKLLLMFPMIMALLAGGRIFAAITSGNTATMFNPHLAVAHLGPIPIPHMASVTSFAEILIIVAAYFAPYFLLPQTFKWGGVAMSAIGKGVQQGVERGSKPAKEYLNWRQGLSPWKQARAARRAKQELRAKTEFYGGLSAEGTQGRVRRARLGGLFRPTREGYRAERALRDSIVSGGAQRAEEEALKEANQALEQELATHPAALADHDQYVIDIARAGPGANVHGRVRNEADWRAAVEKLYQYGGPNNRVFLQLHQEAFASRDPAARERWEKVTNALAPQIIPKFPMVHKDRDYSQRNVDPASPNFGALGDLNTTITQLTPESFTKNGIEGEAVETIMGHLSVLIREGATPGATAGQVARANQARAQVATMYSLFNQTVTGESTRGNVNPAAGRAMLAAAGANPTELTRMNNERRGRGPGVPEIDAAVINHTILTSPDPDIPRAISSILANVRPDGNPR